MSFASMKEELSGRVASRMAAIRESHLSQGLLDALETADIKEEVQKVASNGGKDPSVTIEVEKGDEEGGFSEDGEIPEEIQAMLGSMIPNMAGAVKTMVGNMALAARTHIDSSLASVEMVIWEHEGLTMALEQECRSDFERIKTYGKVKALELRLEQELIVLKRSIEHATKVIGKARHLNTEGIKGGIMFGGSPPFGFPGGPFGGG